MATMRASEIQARSIVIAFSALSVLLAAAGWVLYPGELTLPLALVSVLPPLCVAVVRAKRNGLADPLAVFASCFAAYNGVLLVRMSCGVGAQEMPFATNGATYFRAGVLSGLGSLGLLAGWLLSNDRRAEPMTQGGASESTASFLMGCAFYIVGIALYMVQYWQVGGYMQSIAMDRGQRFEMLTHAVSMPYQGFVLSGLGLMVYAGLGISKPRMVLSAIGSLVWLVLVLVQGDRRLALQLIMALAVVIGTLRPKVMKLRPVALVCIAAAYSGAVVFGQYRTFIYDLAAGRSTLKQAEVAAQSEDSVLSKPEESELGGPYISVLYYSSGTEPLRWGSSYATSVPAVVPKALYPGVKTPAISADLDQALHEGIGPVYGLGFSPVAEGYANFGFVGPFGAMVLWSMFFAWLGSNRCRGLAGMLVCAGLLQEAVNANRIDFRYVYFESVYCSIVAILAVIMVKVFSDITRRGQGPLGALPSRVPLVSTPRHSFPVARFR